AACAADAFAPPFGRPRCQLCRAQYDPSPARHAATSHASRSFTRRHVLWIVAPPKANWKPAWGTVREGGRASTAPHARTWWSVPPLVNVTNAWPEESDCRVTSRAFVPTSVEAAPEAGTASAVAVSPRTTS